MNTLTKLISWTGWTKQDWIDFFYIFNPIKLISWTGWSKEDWVEFVTDVATGFFAAAIFAAIFFMIFISGLSVV